MECVGRGVGGEPALYRFFSSGGAGGNSRRPVFVHRFVLVQQRFPRAWSGVQDIAAVRSLDSGCIISSARVHFASPPGDEPADSVHGLDGTREYRSTEEKAQNLSTKCAPRRWLRVSFD